MNYKKNVMILLFISKKVYILNNIFSYDVNDKKIKKEKCEVSVETRDVNQENLT